MPCGIKDTEDAVSTKVTWGVTPYRSMIRKSADVDSRSGTVTFMLFFSGQQCIWEGRKQGGDEVLVVFNFFEIPIGGNL